MISVALNPDRLFNQVEAQVIVTSSPLPSGKTYNPLPRHEYKSSTYLWLLPE